MTKAQKKKYEAEAEKLCKLQDQIHRDCYVAGFLAAIDKLIGNHPLNYIAELESENRKAKKIISEFVKWIKEVSCNYFLLEENEKEMIARAESFLKE